MSGPLRRTPKASGWTERSPSRWRKCLEARRGRVELRQLPAPGARLLGQGRYEGVDGCGVLDVPEKLAASPAGDIAPAEWGLRVCGRHAPPPLGHAHGGAVPAGQERQPRVGEGEAASCGGNAGREAEPFQGFTNYDTLGPETPSSPRRSFGVIQDLGVASATPASTARAAISASVGSLFPFR